MNIEDKILNKIKKENLKPTSVWYFLLRDYSLWNLVLLSILFSALSIAPIIFIIDNLELGYVKHISESAMQFILLMLPYPFIILAILCTYLSLKAWQKTKKGYKVQGKYVLIISLILSLMLGIILNLFTFGQNIDDTFDKHTGGFYRGLGERREANWFNPD